MSNVPLVRKGSRRVLALISECYGFSPTGPPNQHSGKQGPGYPSRGYRPKLTSGGTSSTRSSATRT